MTILASAVPPRIVFLNKDRPSGLEFPACKECNEGSRTSDLVVGLFSRISFAPIRPVQIQEFGQILDQLVRREPSLVKELEPTPDQKDFARMAANDIDLSAFNCRGPILRSHMLSFAAKLAAALHYQTVGTCVPNGGRIYSLWLTNETIFDGSFPSALAEMLGEVKIIRQGKKTSDSQFWFQSDFDRGESVVGMSEVESKNSSQIISSSFDNPHNKKGNK